MIKNIFDALSIKEESNINHVNDDKEAKNQGFFTAGGFTILEKTKEKTTTKNDLPKTFKTVGDETSSPIKINVGDFPVLSTTPLTKEQRRKIHDSNLKSHSDSYGKNEEKVDERTAAFNHMADKEKVAKSLACTKACHNVVRDKETGEFGVCWRKVCTFAHSEEELQPPRCSFDLTCRFKQGRNDRKTRKLIPGSQCKFHHSDETIEEYYKRSGTKLPDLPPTSEKTRKIPEDKNSSKPDKTTMKKFNAAPPPTTSPTSTPSPDKVLESSPRSWGEEPSHKRRPYDSEGDSSSSESESSDDEDHRRRRSLERSHRISSPSKKSPAPQIIRVPTKELAAIAIKAAFDRGQYNVQILVE